MKKSQSDQRITKILNLLHQMAGDEPIHISYQSFATQYRLRYKKAYCERTFRNYFKKIETLGFIQIKHRFNKSNEYVITEAGKLSILPGKKQSKNRSQKPSCFSSKFAALNDQKNGSKQGFQEKINPAKKQKNLPPNIYKSYKSYKSADEFSSPKPKVLVKVLHEHAIDILGEPTTGRLNKVTAAWLHQAYKQLGSNIDSFVALLKKAASRMWLKSRPWFSLKWLLKFENMHRLLDGGWQDFSAQNNKKDVQSVMKLNPASEKESWFNRISSQFFRTGDFPEYLNMVEKEEAVAYFKVQIPNLGKRMQEKINF